MRSFTDGLLGKFTAPNKVKNNNRPSDSTLFNQLITKAFSSATEEFQNNFVYGKEMEIIHKERPKKMQVYLDTFSQNLLWISSKTKAFLLDLYFTTVHYKRFNDSTTELDKSKFYFALKHLESQVIFVFSDQKQSSSYFNLFNVYISDLKKKYPNYTLYFSNVRKLHAYNSAKTGSYSINYDQILEISEKVGLHNRRQNEDVLNVCLKYNNLAGIKKGISSKCFDDYFEAQFCSRKVQPIFQLFSKQKLGHIKKDTKIILKKIMSPEQFTQFLKKSQKEEESHIRNILAKYQGELSFLDFSNYLYDSQLNNVSRMPKLDQDFPLKDYFCYSSHNTYLSGNQLTSDSQVQRYSEDLDNGIKCVQIDIHNDSDKPMVNHAFKGWGLCKPIDFQDVIKVIKVYSEKCFLQDIYHYPVILSLQNHANSQNNELMLENVTKHFKDKLFMVTGVEDGFPTLSYLKGKILLKTNSAFEELKHFKKNAIVKKLSTFGNDLYTFEPAHKNFANKELEKRYSNFHQFKMDIDRRKYAFNSRLQKKQQILAFLPIMTKVTSIFKSSQGINGKNLSEFGCTSLTFSSVLKAPADTIIRYTKTSWLRTYPHGTQVYSSNYDPAPMLAVGAQIIALNTQTKDDYAWMLNGYFCGGHCSNLSERGYVLKPQRLRHHKNKEQAIQQIQSYKTDCTLKIQIIQNGGHDILMKFYGLQEDMVKNIRATDTFSYCNPDQSFVIFNIGQKYKNCVAIRWIQEGYRVLEGKDVTSYMDCGKRVLIKVTITKK